MLDALTPVEHIPVALRPADDLCEVAFKRTLEAQEFLIRRVGKGRALKPFAKRLQVGSDSLGRVLVAIEQKIQRPEEVFMVARRAVRHLVTERERTVRRCRQDENGSPLREELRRDVLRVLRFVEDLSKPLHFVEHDQVGSEMPEDHPLHDASQSSHELVAREAGLRVIRVELGHQAVLPSSSVGEESLSPNHPDTSSRF